MRKLLILFSLLIIICIFHIECTKDQNSSANNNLPTVQQQLIANAKIYFESNVQNTGNNGKSLNDLTNGDSGQFNPVKSLIKNAVWNRAYTINLAIGEIVVLPVQFNDSLYENPSYADTTTRLSINKLSKLIVYTDSAKQMHAEVVTAFPDKDFIKNPKSSFSGVALVQDWQGNFLRAYQYQNGKTTLLSLGNSKNNKVGTNAISSPNLINVNTTCNEVDWYTCGELPDGSLVECHYTYTQDLGCTTTYEDDGSGVGGAGYGTVAGGGGGGASNAILIGLDASPVACASFVFKNNGTTLNYQEAGVSGLFYDVRAGGQVINNFPFRTIYVGVPLKLKNGQIISEGLAAEEAANAATIAGEQLQSQYDNRVPSPSTQMDAQFASLIQISLSGLIGAQCNVYFKPTLSTTVVTPVVWLGLPGSGGRYNTGGTSQ